MENLQVLLEKHLCQRVSKITDVGRTFKLIKAEDGAHSLLFIREIDTKLETYNVSISDKTFGPELLHERDFHAIQFKLVEHEGCQKCLYVVRTPDGMYHYGSSLVYDPYYLNWHQSTTA